MNNQKASEQERKAALSKCAEELAALIDQCAIKCGTSADEVIARLLDVLKQEDANA